MSTPNEFPGPEQPGSQPPPEGYGSRPEPSAPQNPSPGNPPPGPPAPPPGYKGGPAAPPPAASQPPPGYQAPPGYQQPYQQPGQQPARNFRAEMPTDMPHSLSEAMHVGGFSGLFTMNGLPQLLKISYIIWLVTAGLWLLFTVLLLIGSLIALDAGGIVAAIISLALTVVMLVSLMKLKEGMQWARMALSVIAFLSIVMAFIGAGGGLLGIVATVLMWLPESSAWLNARAKGVAG